MQHEPTYSQIIDPAIYNALIAVHLHIATADDAIVKIVAHHSSEMAEVVEFGCGPARILPLLAKIPTINLTGIDYDKTFFDYTQAFIKQHKLRARVLLADAATYKHYKNIDVAVSQGFHHHMPKGEETHLYLRNIYEQLKQGGIYVVGDEFLPHYQTDHERLLRAVAWYSHVIHAALKRPRDEHCRMLAIEEAKTLIDDLAEGTLEGIPKSEAKIQLVLKSVYDISASARYHAWAKTKELATEFLDKLNSIKDEVIPDNPSMNLSRGDFKICHRVFQQEVEEVGFKIIGVKTVGPIETIGGMAVYTLQKE